MRAGVGVRREQFAVARGVRAAQLVPAVEVFELNAEHRALNAFEPEVVADDFVTVLLLGAVVAQQPDAARDFLVIRHDAPPSPYAPRFLPGIEAEAARASERADAPALVARAVRLRRVFDDDEIMARGDLEKRRRGRRPGRRGGRG